VWKPFGINGLSITGQDGCSSVSVVVLPSFGLCVVPRYHPAGNLEQSKTVIPFGYKAGQWSPIGPAKGIATSSEDRVRLFEVRGTLFLQKYGDDLSIFRLSNDKLGWEKINIDDLLLKNPICLCNQGRCILTKNGRQFRIYEFDQKGALQEWSTFSGEYFNDVSAFTVSPNGDSLLVVNGDDEKHPFVFLNRERESWVSTPLKNPQLGRPFDFSWDDNGQLIVGTSDGQVVYGYKLTSQGEWQKQGQAREEHVNAVTYSPRLGFTASGETVITWEKFVPRH
jgi:hypothetical protein